MNNLKFIYTNKKGVLVQVIPTQHSIERFNQRYCILMDNGIVTKFPKGDSNMLMLMLTLFNSGQRYSTDYIQGRNGSRGCAISMIHIRSGNFDFVVDPVNKLILTSEILGTLRRFNKVPLKKELS